MSQTTLSVSAHHFALSCLYFVCLLNAPVSVDCRKDGDSPSVALIVIFFPAGKTASHDYALGTDACLLYCRFKLLLFYNKCDIPARLGYVVKTFVS